MNNMEGIMDEIIVTDMEKVEPDDFYLSEDWQKRTGADLTELRKLAKDGKLFVAYRVPAKSYALYWQMDALQVFINEDKDEVMSCEGVVIGNKHAEKWEAED